MEYTSFEKEIIRRMGLSEECFNNTCPEPRRYKPEDRLTGTLLRFALVYGTGRRKNLW